MKRLKASQVPFDDAVPNKVIQHVLRRLDYTNFERLHPKSDNITAHIPVIMVPSTIEIKHLKAVKSDDAGVYSCIWDERVLSAFPHLKYDEIIVDKLDVLRRFFLKTWIRRVWKSFMMYLVQEYGKDWALHNTKCRDKSELRKDISQFVDCAFRARGATWLEWVEGSTLFFWRWAKDFRKMARDGIHYWFKGRKPRIKKPQAYEKDDSVRSKVTDKLTTVRKKGYIKPGYVTSLIKYFAAPKGDDDVRMVYDGTSSRFNDHVWAPSFSLPTIDSMLRSVDHNTWLGDLDAGEQFLNFVRKLRSIVVLI